MNRELPPLRDCFPYWTVVSTRWNDNDVYGHVNNVVYYSYFDSAVNQLLIEVGGLDIRAGSVIGVVAESKCRFAHPLAYPERLDIGVAIEHLGTRSVRYGVGVFRQGEDRAAAWGYLVHVFVERVALSPVPIPEDLRRTLEHHRRGET